MYTLYPAVILTRQWYTVTVVTASGHASLYVDGHLTSHRPLVSTTEACSSISLDPSLNDSGWLNE